MNRKPGVTAAQRIAGRPRVADFFNRVRALIPCHPENEDSRKRLDQMPAHEMLFVYMNWADRFVARRPRTCRASKDFLHAPGVKKNWEQIQKIVNIAESGGDLTPYLSRLVRHAGFMTKPRRKPNSIAWDNRDFVLNSLEFHHLHLKPLKANEQRSGDSNDLIFCRVSRNQIYFAHLGDHKSFDDGSLLKVHAELEVAAGRTLQISGPEKTDQSDREQMKLARHGFSGTARWGGSITIGTHLMGSGDSPFHIDHVGKLRRRCIEDDEKLDTIVGQSEVFGPLADSLPEKPEFEWFLEHCDLVVLEKTKKLAAKRLKWRR